MTDKDSDREVGMVLDPGGKPGTLDPALGATAFIVDGGGSVRMTRSRMQDEAADASAGAVNLLDKYSWKQKADSASSRI